MKEYDLANITRRDISQIRRLEGVEKATESKKASGNTTVLPDRNMFIPTQRCLLKSLNKSIIKYPNISA
jgi:hypothetical protein